MKAAEAYIYIAHQIRGADLVVRMDDEVLAELRLLLEMPEYRPYGGVIWTTDRQCEWPYGMCGPGMWMSRTVRFIQ